jgi:hypothetical protein
VFEVDSDKKSKFYRGLAGALHEIKDMVDGKNQKSIRAIFE